MNKESLVKRKKELESQKKQLEMFLQNTTINLNCCVGALHEINTLIASFDKEVSENQPEKSDEQDAA